MPVLQELVTKEIVAGWTNLRLSPIALVVFAGMRPGLSPWRGCQLIGLTRRAGVSTARGLRRVRNCRPDPQESKRKAAVEKLPPRPHRTYRTWWGGASLIFACPLARPPARPP